MEGKNQKPVKNYVILGCIYLLTIFVVIYLCTWYQEYEEYKKTIPELHGIVPEMTKIELGHYVQESDKALVFLCVPSDDTCRQFEKDLKKLIQKRELKDSMVYLNLQDELKAPILFQELKEQYQIKETLSYYPAFLLFENGTVDQVLQGNAYTDLSLGEVEQFLDMYFVDE